MTKLHQKKSQNNQQKSKLWKELPILTPPAENVSKFAPSQHPTPKVISPLLNRIFESYENKCEFSFKNIFAIEKNVYICNWIINKP